MNAGTGKSVRIFISYRRDETAYPADWLYDRLIQHFGAGSVFKDVDSIEFGDDFDAAIANAVAACDVLLALIGERWVTLTDERGHRRLDQPDDFVRREIEAALTRAVRVIPVLVDRARMPQANELPPSLAPLVRRQAVDISLSGFDIDAARLIAMLKKTLDEDGLHPGTEDRATSTPHRRARLALAAGSAVVFLAGALIIAIPQSATGMSSAPTTTPTTALTTPGLATPSPGTVLAADDFSSTANGWSVSAVSPAGGRLINGAFRLSVDPAPGGTGAGAVPRDAAAIYPVAPPNVEVEVTGTRLASSETQMEYGVMCRANRDEGSGYFLTLSNRYAEINKSSPDAEWQPLIKKPIPVAAGVPHRLRIECRSADGGSSTHLSLSVDDRLLAEYVDRVHPLKDGCVGLWIGMDASAQRTGEAEFDDFTARAG